MYFNIPRESNKNKRQRHCLKASKTPKMDSKENSNAKKGMEVESNKKHRKQIN